MIKKIKINIFKKRAIAEELAIKFYESAGYKVEHKIEDYYMHKSKHPMEIMFLQNAYLAIEYFCNNPLIL
jgi:hypothetical protein